MNVMETQRAIAEIKEYFQRELSNALTLDRVSAPLFVMPETGLNDNLNGTERRVSFTVKAMGEKEAEVVQSLAKWKRYALKKYGIQPGKGIYTDMNAIRRDEELDPLHSLYVDQWDWEKTIRKEDRTSEYLHETVRKIYDVLLKLADHVNSLYQEIDIKLPKEIFFITTQQLEDRYPECSPKERERSICKEYGAVFVEKIGGKLASGQKHDGRAPDYDDWELNGDILLYNEITQDAFEISSMGIRVDENAMAKQLKLAHEEDKEKLPFHKDVLEGMLPYSIGGGIGQSRLCMYFLKKSHIGEVQASIWPEEMVRACREKGIELL